jgi:ubiquinone/menaquinone biosynthesis C-methylase UbiE
MSLRARIITILKLIHEENCDPLDLPPQARKGIYDQRDAVFFHFAKGKNVLELGCGYGYNAFLFSKNANMVIGVDVDKDAIERATKRFKDISNLAFIEYNALDFLNN